MRITKTIKTKHFFKALLVMCVFGLPGVLRPSLAQEAKMSKQIPNEIAEPIKKILAPSGSLRVGVYPGSPSSLIIGTTKELNTGVGYELGRAFANYIGVPFEPVVFQMNGEVLAAAKEGKIDFVFSNATAVRSQYIDFVEPVLLIEQSYMVGALSKVNDIGQIDTPNTRIGVSAGSTSEATLPGLLKYASIVVTPNLKVAQDKLSSGEIDAFATNKAILFELADKIPGSRVLPGAWGFERISLGIPKGREQAIPVLAKFSQHMLDSGLVKQAAERSGLRGLKQD
jgi:polar amino acid transport system substrate-binding protein